MVTFPSISRAPRWALCSVLPLVLLALIITPALAQTTTPTSPTINASQQSSANNQPTATATPELPPSTEIKLIPSQTSLLFQGLVGESLGRTFTLTARGGEATNVRMSAGDLLETTTNRAILSTQVTVNPMQVASIGSNDIQSVDVTIAPGTARAGTYKGVLSIWYTELSNAAPVKVTLQVVLNANPSVAADANSVNQTLFAQTRSIPYIGAPTIHTPPSSYSATSPVTAPTSCPCAPPVRTGSRKDEPPNILGELPITLVENTGDDAVIEGAEVLSVRSSTNLILPTGVVTVQATLPITIPGYGAATLPLVLQGRNLPAGSYAGTLRVQVTNQPAVIQVPFNLKLKDNWLWAFLVLAASLSVGALVTWYNDRGIAALKIARDIDLRARKIKKNPGHLQVAERDSASQLLAAAMDSVQNAESQAAIDAQLTKLDEYIQSQAEAIATLIAQNEEVSSQITALDSAPVIQQNLWNRQKALANQIEQGSLISLDEGNRLLAELKTEPNQLLELQKAIASAGLEQAQIDAIGLSTAGSVQEIGENLRALLIKQVDALIDDAGRVEIGVRVRDALVKQLREASESLKVADLNALSGLIPAIKQMKEEVNTLQSHHKTWIDKGKPEGQILDSLNAATTLAALGQTLDALPTPPPPAGGALVTDEIPVATTEAGFAIDPLDSLFSILARFKLGEHASAEERAWKAHTFKIQAGALVVKGLLYLFAMLVGWAALYLSNQTFGARPEDYISLFLWGATVNVIGGQQLSLNSIYQHKAPGPPGAEDAANNQAGG